MRKRKKYESFFSAHVGCDACNHKFNDNFKNCIEIVLGRLFPMMFLHQSLMLCVLLGPETFCVVVRFVLLGCWALCL